MSSPTISKNPLFGRAWELSIDTSLDGITADDTITVSSSAWDPEALRITFDVDLPAFKSLWFARISIYNLNAPTAQKILSQGMAVTLKAGYQLPGADIIFKGQIYQPLWERENVTDLKLTLMCYTGLKETIGNFASFRGTAFSTQNALVQKMVAGAFTPIPVGTVDTTALTGTTLPRARAFFGDPMKFFDRVARANNLQSWVGFDGLYITNVEAESALVNTITYTPTTGIVGTPQQTEDGVAMRVLLDPRLQILATPIQVKIDNAVIRQLPRYPGSIPSRLDMDGTYLVMGLNFTGDSRGNDWYTDIVGATSIGGKLAMIADASDPNVSLDRRAPR